jgi:cation diffusion facilitator CzcD-associated flavoprotein CzcO
MEKCDVAIVGAGPYGLSAASHLASVKGLEVRLFGEPMSFWEQCMPEEMLLRSPWDGSHIADPENRLTLDAYRNLNGNRHLSEPLPLKDFIRYGHWFREQAKLSPDRRKVVRIQPATNGYQLELESGEPLLARRVVVAAGIQVFANRPRMFARLPSSLVTHAVEHRNFGKFCGKEVLVIGGGQSALETAALLSEAGAHVEVLVRNSSIHWLGHHQWMSSKHIAWMFYGRGGIGPAGVSLIIQQPQMYRRLPRWVQDWWAVRALRPAGAAWLKPRTQNVTIHTKANVNQVRIEGERLHIRLSDEDERIVDHVVLGTGYRVNLALYPFLPPELVRRLELVNGYPRLQDGFESSSPGLHFLGAPARWSFGPLMRFVAGTEFSSKALRERILQTARPVRLATHRRVPAQFPQSRRPAADVAVGETRAFQQTAGSYRSSNTPPQQ